MLSTDEDLFGVALCHCLLATDRRLLVVTPALPAAERLAEEVRDFLELVGCPEDVQVLPELEMVRRQLLPENESERSRVFDRSAGSMRVFICSVLGLVAPAPRPQRFRERNLLLRSGDTSHPPEVLARLLTDLDYDNEMLVRVPGEYSWRGGILDVFCPAYDDPLRLDYFGNALESVRLFDPETQRSFAVLDECRIIPRGEHVLLRDEDGEADCCFLDYFEPEALQLLITDPEEVDSHVAEYGDSNHRRRWRRCLKHPHVLRLVDRHSAVPEAWGEAAALPYFAPLELTGVLADSGAEERDILRRQWLEQELRRWHDTGSQVVFCSSNERRRERVAELAGDIPVKICDHELSRGALLPQVSLVLLSETEVFGRGSRIRVVPKKTSFHTDHLLHAGTELTVEDFAVHAVHGICRFQGIREETFREQQQEVMVLEFRDDVRLFVPLEQAYLVSRYVGARKTLPRLSRIGAPYWKRAREAAAEAVSDLASELLRIQAMRQATPGFSFGDDEESYRQFEAAFPYRETDDQARAVAEVEVDMATPQPMDRLICGDVGFGKTEVAMRAAFKAVVAGKQVAVLAPTTVLVQQHYLTFLDRFRDFPVLIESLSRFKSGGEQREVLRAVREGRVDIVIGTHRLLSGDIQFKDLGLLVIDEEQRFGVRHKERLKQLRANVDILTMTATPIPRTLYLSLSGLRNMSTIVTPPDARLPVQTVVGQYDPRLIEDAIRREIQRDGQVLYLHNRVRNIEKVFERLSDLVPEASFDIAHGQMERHELEAAMLRFIEGRTDVLICTTIIESGMDIPNANTIIIERADRFGLADLYQLRGRVGRYHRQAYAYLLLPRYGSLQVAARERLAAIRKYTQLGAGFKLALRDLEIRGAGNLLGAEQSGHISAIGFELYCQLLREAVSRLKGKPLPARRHVDLTLDFLVLGQAHRSEPLSAAFPTEYIGEEDLRVECYRRLSNCRSLDDLERFHEELRDRFGPLPEPAEHLLTTARLRLLAARAGLHAVTVREGRVYLHGDSGLVKTDGPRLPRLPQTDAATQLRALLQLLEGLAT